MPLPLRIFDYTERTQPPKTPPAAPQPQSEQYVTRAEFDALAAKVAAVDYIRVNRETEVGAHE